MKKYTTYILECSDASYYVGVTEDIMQMERQHNKGLDKKSYTYRRRPVKLVWREESLDPDLAIAREKQLKGWSRQKKRALIHGEYDKLPDLSKNNPRQARTDNKWILEKLPYTKSFLFADTIDTIHENGAEGSFLFKKNLPFYEGHFKNFAVTPGVILTECCAQIGVVCLGIYLFRDKIGPEMENSPQIALSSSEMEFYLPVFPEETVKVVSEKVYFRFGKLKCKVKMFNSNNKLVCKGVLAGMFKLNTDGK